MKTELPYHEWLITVDRAVKRWITWRLEVYRLAMYLGDLASLDLERICAFHPAIQYGDFLMHANRIGAKIAFAHGPGFRAMQWEGFNEALSSARAARQWYECCGAWLGDERTRLRLAVLDTITNNLLLLTRVPDGFDPDGYDDEPWNEGPEEGDDDGNL